MAIRASQVVVEVLRSTAGGVVYTPNATNTITFTPSPTQNRVTTSTAAVTITFTPSPIARRDVFPSASSLVTLSYAATESNEADVSAATMLLFSYSASEVTGFMPTATSTVTFLSSASGVRDVFPAATTTVTIGYEADAVKDAVASAASAITLGQSVGQNGDFPVSAASAITFSQVATEQDWIFADVTTGITFSSVSSQSPGYGVAAVSSLTFGSSSGGSRAVFSSATSTVTFTAAGSVFRAKNASAVTSFSLSSVPSEIRDAAVFAVTNVGIGEFLAGDGRLLTASRVTFDGEATAVRDLYRSAITNAILIHGSVGARDLPMFASSVVTISPRATQVRDIHPAATSALAVSQAEVVAYDFFLAAASGLVFDGTYALGPKDAVAIASAAITFSDPSAGLRAVNASAANAIDLATVVSYTRIGLAYATTNITIHVGQNASPPLFAYTKAIGGNPMAAQYSSYLGQYQQGRTVNLLLRTMGYQGRVVTPDAPPTVKLYADDGTYVAGVIPAMDATNGIFSLPLFLDLRFPLGRYRVAYRWVSSGQTWARIDYFEVIDGGDPNGAVISLCSYDRPEANYVLAQMGAGKLVQGRSPRI